MIGATGGTSPIELLEFVGGGKPLPKEYFGYWYMRKLTVFFMVFYLIGCSKVSYDYYYISLENLSDVRVTKREKIKLKNLEGDAIIPREYVLSSKNYDLIFYINDTAYFPHVRISAIGNEQDIYLKPNRDFESISSDGNICSSFHQEENKENELYFFWSSSCLNDEYLKNISFDVVNDKGLTLNEENIPFSLKLNGVYSLVDAI